MKIGISTATFFTKLLTENSFSVIKQCGGECAEIFLTTYYEYEKDFGKILKEKTDGLEIYSIHTLNTQFEPQLFNAAPRTYNDALKLYKKALQVGQIVGAKCYTFHGIARLKEATILDPVKIGKRMFELGEIAQDYGIKLCLENVHWASCNSPEFFEIVKEYAPNIGAVLDIKQARQSNRHWKEYLNVMGSSLENVHISDVKDGKIEMVGQGEFPFEELIAELKKIEYNKALIIEQYASNYEDFSQVKKSVEYMKNLVGGNYANQI